MRYLLLLAVALALMGAQGRDTRRPRTPEPPTYRTPKIFNHDPTWPIDIRGNDNVQQNEASWSDTDLRDWLADGDIARLALHRMLDPSGNGRDRMDDLLAINDSLIFFGYLRIHHAQTNTADRLDNALEEQVRFKYIVRDSVGTACAMFIGAGPDTAFWTNPTTGVQPWEINFDYIYEDIDTLRTWWDRENAWDYVSGLLIDFYDATPAFAAGITNMDFDQDGDPEYLNGVWLDQDAYDVWVQWHCEWMKRFREKIGNNVVIYPNGQGAGMVPEMRDYINGFMQENADSGPPASQPSKWYDSDLAALDTLVAVASRRGAFERVNGIVWAVPEARSQGALNQQQVIAWSLVAGVPFENRDNSYQADEWYDAGYQLGPAFKEVWDTSGADTTVWARQYSNGQIQCYFDDTGEKLDPGFFFDTGLFESAGGGTVDAYPASQ